MSDTCTAYRAKSMICKNGFIQAPVCRGRYGCVHCGMASCNELPNCMKDSLPEHWVNDSGGPRFYRQEQTNE